MPFNILILNKKCSSCEQSCSFCCASFWSHIKNALWFKKKKKKEVCPDPNTSCAPISECGLVWQYNKMWTECANARTHTQHGLRSAHRYGTYQNALNSIEVNPMSISYHFISFLIQNERRTTSRRTHGHGLFSSETRKTEHKKKTMRERKEKRRRKKKNKYK